MEEGKTYPFIDYIYGGMQIANVPKAFTWKTANGREIFGGLQEYAQLGIAGIILMAWAPLAGDGKSTM